MGFIQKKALGENNHEWKGGISEKNELRRRKAIWQIWRNAVFLRDNFTCQNPNCEFCHNKRGGLLHPHHIKSIALFPELAFKINNGITYCEQFHIHGKLHSGIKKVVRRIL